jgi:hypothetical protein
MTELTDLRRGLEALAAKRPLYDSYFDYYYGNQPIRYSRSRLADVFDTIDSRFTQNWIAAVIDNTLERLELVRFDVMEGENVNEQISGRLNSLWSQLELDRDEDLAELAMLITREAYFIVEPTDQPPGILAFYNDPRLVHVFYREDNPRLMKYGVKLWEDETEHYMATLYYPDRRIVFRSKTPVNKMSQHGAALSDQERIAFFNITVGMFEMVEEIPADRVPIFHLRQHKTEMVDLIPPQDAINKLAADMMIAAEFGAFPQRYAITNADTSDLRNAPSEIWTLPPSDGIGEGSKVGQFDPATLTPYLEAIQSYMVNIAVASKTPRHYLLVQGGDPSGESLIAMEAPLNKKCRMIEQKFLRPVYQAMGQYLLELDGAAVSLEAVTPVFDVIQTVQPMTQAIIAKTLRDADADLKAAALAAGYDDETADRLAANDVFMPVE